MITDQDFQDIGSMTEEEAAKQIQLCVQFITCVWIELGKLDSEHMTKVIEQIADTDPKCDTEAEREWAQATVKFLKS